MSLNVSLALCRCLGVICTLNETGQVEGQKWDCEWIQVQGQWLAGPVWQGWAGSQGTC